MMKGKRILFSSRLAPHFKRFAATDVPDDGSSAARASGAKPIIRTLVIMNDPRALSGGLTFLEKRGYKHVIAKNIREAKNHISEFRPHVVLLSWNLKNAEVKKIYRLLTTKFKLICVVFAEDSTARTTASLMSSGIPHSLLAPVSGPSIHMRVQALLRPKAVAVQARRRTPVGESYGNVSVKASQIPKETLWEIAGQDDKGRPTWRGTPLHDPTAKSAKDKRQNVFYFSGSHPPIFDEQNQTWESPAGQEKGDSFFQEGVQKSKMYSATQEGSTSIEYEALQEATESEEYNAIQEGLKSKEYEATQKGIKGKEFNLSEQNPSGENAEDFNWDAALKSVESEFDSLAAAAEAADEEDDVADEDFDLEKHLEDGKGYVALKKTRSKTAKSLSDKDLSEENDSGWNKLTQEENLSEEEDPSQKALGKSEKSRKKEVLSKEKNLGTKKGLGKEQSSDKKDGTSTTGSETDTGTTDLDTTATAKGNFGAQSAQSADETESQLRRALRIAAEKLILPAQVDCKPVGLISTAALVPITTKNFKGYLMAVNAANQNPDELMKSVAVELKTELEKVGQKMSATPPVWAVTFDPLEFQGWAKKNAEFSLFLTNDTDTIAFSFVSCENFPQTVTAADDSVLGISLDKDLKGDISLLFDLYLHMPKNDKFLLYLNKGSNLSSSTIDKFIRFGITEVYIRKDQKDLFLAYCARNYILSKKVA